MPVPSLHDLLRGGVGARPVSLGPVDEVEALLLSHVDAGRALVPDCELTDERYCAHLAARLPENDPEGLSRVRGADLFLAAALLSHDRAALEYFERSLVPVVRSGLERLRVDDVSEAMQRLRVSLLLGERPSLALYAGRGSLEGFLRVSAARHAFRASGLGLRATTVDLELFTEVLPSKDVGPAERTIQKDLRVACEEALVAALAGLAPRARNLLRQSVLDGLSIDELAKLYRVHRATCARWLSDARDELARRTRSTLRERLALPPRELESLLRSLDSQWSLSVHRLLARTNES